MRCGSPLSVIRVRADPASRTRGMLIAGAAGASGRARPRRHPGEQAGGRRRNTARRCSGSRGCGGVPIAHPRPRDPAAVAADRPRTTPGARTPPTGATTARSGCRRCSPATGSGGEDHLYDFIIEIDHNTRPRVAGRGSAVFIHVARPGLAPTAGCVALPWRELLRESARARLADTRSTPRSSRMSENAVHRFSEEASARSSSCSPRAPKIARPDPHMGRAERDRGRESPHSSPSTAASGRCAPRSWRSARNAAPAPPRTAGCTSGPRSSSP